MRLKEYDYARAGAYFITVCTRDRECLFGDIVHGEVRLNDAGRIVADAWAWLGLQYAHVELDAWLVMPNHLHGIIVLLPDTLADGLDAGDTDVDGDGANRPGRGGSRTAPTRPVAIDSRYDHRMIAAHADATAADDSDANDVGADRPGRGGSRTAPTPPRKPLGGLIGAFKTVSTKRLNAQRDTPGVIVWQRNFYEHIIRDETGLNRIRQYIDDNPRRWTSDQINPGATATDPEGGHRP